MAADRKTSEQSGPYMIQDRDHQAEPGQMGAQAGRGNPRQSEQSQGESRAQTSNHGSGQQGGERTRRRTKLL